MIKLIISAIDNCKTTKELDDLFEDNMLFATYDSCTYIESVDIYNCMYERNPRMMIEIHNGASINVRQLIEILFAADKKWDELEYAQEEI